MEIHWSAIPDTETAHLDLFCLRKISDCRSEQHANTKSKKYVILSFHDLHFHSESLKCMTLSTRSRFLEKTHRFPSLVEENNVNPDFMIWKKILPVCNTEKNI